MTAPKISAADLAKNARIINEAHKEIVAAERTSLQHAITAGSTLRACKDSVEHGEWGEWLDKNCPDISEETARLYMRLADPKNADRLEAAAEQNGSAVADLSVRGAAKVLAKKQTEEQKAARAAKKKISKVNVAKADVTEQLKALAPDEVLKALKDAEWDTEELTELAKLLNAHLKKLSEAKADPLAIPPSLQRQPPGTQAQSKDDHGPERQPSTPPDMGPLTANAASSGGAGANFTRRV